MAALTEADQRILVFERGWWRFPGSKEREILEVFSMPATRYYQLLNELIDRPEAAEFDPALVARLHQGGDVNELNGRGDADGHALARRDKAVVKPVVGQESQVAKASHDW